MSIAEHVEFIFHGTGNSGSIPSIGCLTALKDSEKCRTCHLAMTPEGHKNFRRNTGGIFRVPRSDGSKATIVIDVGKNFLASAIDWFPKYGIRKIDAIILTHPHADALNGLDDLRGWTDSKQHIQKHIDIYASAESFAYVQTAFPYLISKEFASGGGDVPQFKWHMIEANKPFIAGDTGIEITPFAVHHGKLFAHAPTPGLGLGLPTPASSHPSTPKSKSLSPPHSDTGLVVSNEEEVLPFYCLGFVILDVVYISDVSYIPEATWQIIETTRKRPYSLFILDCLRPLPHTSHFGLAQAVETARRLDTDGKLRTYLVGFCHDVTHAQWEEIGRCLKDASGRLDDPVVTSAIELVPKGRPTWMMPAYDGLRLRIDEEGKVLEDT